MGDARRTGSIRAGGEGDPAGRAGAQGASGCRGGPAPLDRRGRGRAPRRAHPRVARVPGLARPARRPLARAAQGQPGSRPRGPGGSSSSTPRTGPGTSRSVGGSTVRQLHEARRGRSRQGRRAGVPPSWSRPIVGSSSRCSASSSRTLHPFSRAGLGDGSRSPDRVADLPSPGARRDRVHAIWGYLGRTLDGATSPALMTTATMTSIDTAERSRRERQPSRRSAAQTTTRQVVTREAGCRAAPARSCSSRRRRRGRLRPPRVLPGPQRGRRRDREGRHADGAHTRALGASGDTRGTPTPVRRPSQRHRELGQPALTTWVGTAAPPSEASSRYSDSS